MPRKLIKLFSLLLSILLIFEQIGLAQAAQTLDISSYLTQLHNSISLDKFRPLHLRYLAYDNLNNSFQLLLDKGDFFKVRSPQSAVHRETKKKIEENTKVLLDYFFVGIVLPNESFWVNLRPDSEDNVMDEELAKTDAGKILLEADLQLKKDTARFTSPETLEGKEYWDKLYKKAGELLGSQNITIPTLTRPWIVPNEIIVRESKDNNAYIYKATLKVMLEEDYIKSQVTGHKSQVNLQEYSFKDSRMKQLNEYSAQLIRENIIPKLTYEVNTSKRYAPLRQVYYSLILAQWFKSRFYGKGGLYPWLIDKKDLTGLISKDPWSKTAYFKVYQKSFQEGEYNLKEPVYTPFGQSIRSYISGGIGFTSETVSSAIVQGLIPGKQNFSYNHEKVVPVLVSGGETAGDPFGVEIKTDVTVFASAPPPFELQQTKVLPLSQVSATPKEKNTETSSPLVRNEGPKKSFPFPFLRMAKRFVLSISTLGVIIYNLIDRSLDVFAEALADGYELLSESELWRFFKIRILLPLSISLNIKRGIRFRLDDDMQEIEAGNIEIRFGFNKLIFEKKDGRGYFLVDSADENNYLALRKNILSMLSSQIKKTKNIDNAVHFLYLEGGYNIQNFIELAQREGYAEFLGEILSLIKELKSFYGVEYVYPKAILKLFPEKEKILSQLKSIQDILPEFKYEMGVGKEIIDPRELLAMNLKEYHLGDRQLTSLIHTFNPKLLFWDIENAKTIFFRLSQPPSLLLYLLDGSLNKEIRESEGDVNKFVIGALRKPALKVEIDESFKIKGMVPDLKLRGLKKDLVLAYCSHKAFRGVLPLSDLPARKVDNVLPLDFLAEIKKDDELLSVFMGRLNSHRDEFLDNLQNILSIFNPPLLGNIQNIKVIFEDLNRLVFLISPILDGSINEVFLEAKGGGGEFIKNFLNSTIKLSFKEALLRHIFSNEKLVEEYRPLLFEFLGKYPGEFERYFPGITFLCSSRKSFIETLFYGDLRDFSLNKDNIELVRILIRVAADPAIGPERILSRDNNGRYYIIEKLKLFASLGLTNYAQYAVKFPEGTDIVLNSPKFIRLLKEGESALKEFGVRTGEGEPTILSIISDIFAVLQVVSSSERKEIAGLFEGEYIYTLSALDIPYFIENYIVYPEATKLALDYGQLNRYYIELINESLGADKLKTEEGLRQGLYGKQLLAFVNGRVTSENITRLAEKRKKDNEQIRKEVIAEINNDPDFLESSLLDILSCAKEHGLIVSLLSGSSRNPLARYFLKDKFSKEELSKRTKNKDIDIRVRELLFSKDDLLNKSLGCCEEIISLLRERLSDRKIWIPAFEDSIESKIKRFDRAALENLHIKRYMDILDSLLGRELLRGKLPSLYASNAAGADINQDKVREVFNQESSEEFRVLENVVALVKRLTLSRIQEAGIAVDIRGDYSAVTRGDTNINAIEIFYNKEGELDIFDPELGLLDFKEGKARISAGSQAIYGNHRPINAMVTSVSEVALGDALRLFRHKTQFGLELDPEDVKVVKNGLDLLTHKGNSEFLIDKIQRNAEKVLEFLHDEAMDSNQIRSLLENLGGIHSSYPFLFRNIFEGSMQAAADNVLYQYLSAEQRIRYLKGETVYFENIAIHQSGGTAQGEVFKEVPVESIIKDKGLRPGSGQTQTRGDHTAVYFGTDTATRSWGQRNNEIFFIYDQQVLKALISGELKYGDKPLSEYGAYFNEATKHYVMSLPKGKEDVLPLRFAKMVYLTAEFYIKAEAAWRRILNSAILEEVINNSQIPISNKHDKIAEVKTKLSEEYFGRSTEGNIRTFEDVFKNIFSVRFIKPRANTVLFMIVDAVAYEEDGLAEELRSIAVEVFQKTNEEVAEAIEIGQEKAGRIFKEDEAGAVSSAIEQQPTEPAASSTIIEGKSSIKTSEDKDSTLCLTPDSLITLADGSQKPLIELKPFGDLRGRTVGWQEDMVLSLNEGTGKLEPHRVLALLDMGVKPVYRITTASGKSLKTTLTHPYLTKNGWKKLSQIKVGEEVAVANNPDRPSGAQGIKGRKMAGLGSLKQSRANIRTDKDRVKFLQFQTHGKNNGIRRKKIMFDDKLLRIKDVGSGDIHNPYSFDRDIYGKFIQSGPKVSFGNFSSIFSAIKSGNKFRQGKTGNQNSIFLGFKDLNYGVASIFPVVTFDQGAGIKEIQHSLSFFSYPGNLFSQFSLDFTEALMNFLQGRNSFGKHRLRDIFIPRSDGKSFADEILNGNLILNSGHNILTSERKDTITSSLSQVNLTSKSATTPESHQRPQEIAFELITKIEYLGYNHVYDIEIEATHNFIAEGIVAHNTYVGSNQKPWETASSAIGKEFSDEIKKGLGSEDIPKRIETLAEIIKLLQKDKERAILSNFKLVFAMLNDRAWTIRTYALDAIDLFIQTNPLLVSNINFNRAELREVISFLNDNFEKVSFFFEKVNLLDFLSSLKRENLLKKALEGSGRKLFINVYETASINSAKGLIESLALNKNEVSILVGDEISKEAAQNAFPGYEVIVYDASIDDMLKRNIYLEFRDTPKKIQVTSLGGGLQFALPYIPFKLYLPKATALSEVERMKQTLNIGERKVIVLGFPDESELAEFMNVYNKNYANLDSSQRPLVIIALRQRENEFLRLLSNQSIMVRDSKEESLPDMSYHNILILNTQGELFTMYSLADLVVLGSDRNIGEPAKQRKAILYFSGSWYNNRTTKDVLANNGAAEAFGMQSFAKLMSDQKRINEMGKRAAKTAASFEEEVKTEAERFDLIGGVLASLAASSSVEGGFGKCLTPDSLITLADGTTKPLIELKPQDTRRVSQGESDMVLSLNEGIGRLEPHRVLALLDMGVKPVYRITTASGKQLKTTLTHPYLTKDGWRKLQDIKAGEEITVVKEDLSSAVSVFSSINPVNHNAFASHIKTDTILSDSESMGGRRQVNQRPSEGQGVIRREVKFDLFEDASLELKGKFLKFSFTCRSELDFLNHQGFQISPNLCLILAKGTRPNLLASSIPFLSLNTNLGFIGRWASISSISQPTGLWNTYSLAETCSSSLASTAQSKSHNEYVSKIKYFGEPFLSTTTAALKSEDLRPAPLSSLGIGANFASASNLTVSLADNFIKDVDFMFSPPDNFKYNTLISGLSRLIFPSAFAQGEPSDILWDKIISIEPLGPMPVYDIEVEGTHNFIAHGIVAHNTYTEKPVLRLRSGLALSEVEVPETSNQKPVTSNQKSEVSKMVDSPLQEKRKAGSLAIENLKLLKEVLSSYQIIFNLPDTAQEFVPDLILNIWLEIDRHLQAGKIKIDLDAGSLKEFILLFKDEEIVEAVGKILANRVLNLLDRELIKIDKKIRSKEYLSIPNMINELFDNPFVNIVEEAQHDFPKLFENFHNSKNTFMEMLRNRLAPLSSLADQLAKKLSVFEDVDEDGKTMDELLNNYLQATKDLLRQLKFRLEDLTVRRDDQLTPEEKEGLKFVEGELRYALLLRGKKPEIVARLNWSYEPNRNQIDNIGIRVLQPEEQGKGYVMELWRGARLMDILDKKRPGKVVVDEIDGTAQAQGFWREVLKYGNESLPEEKCEIKIMIKDGESKREINLSQLQTGDMMIAFTITVFDGSSSPVKESANDLGGVDFIRLPIISQPEITPPSAMAGGLPLNISHLNLDEEWAQIQKMVNSGIRPSSERLREYALASSSLKSEDYGREIDKLLGCIADILRLEEERVLPIEPTLREILVLLESDKPANELQSYLSKITVLPKEPKPFENF